MQHSYLYSPDEFSRSVASKARSSRFWNVEKVLDEVEREAKFVNPYWGWFSRETEQVLVLETGRYFGRRWSLVRGIGLLSNLRRRNLCDRE